VKGITTKRETYLRGLPVSGGIACGLAHPIARRGARSIPFYTVPPAQADNEVRRLDAAVEAAALQLERIVEKVSARIGEARANIFVAQRMMVLDPVLRDQMHAAVRDRHLNAEAAVDRTLESYEAMLAELDDEYLRERASDIGEIRRRLLEYLRGHEGEGIEQDTAAIPGDRPVILVAEELTPQETVGLDTTSVAGFITERGGPASHAAILARALGIPAVSGIEDAVNQISRDCEVLLNGGTGEVILSPSAETLRHQPTTPPRLEAMSAIEPVPELRVMANINLASEATRVRDAHAEGIGLYRTEFECLSLGRMLTEDEQYARYCSLVNSMSGLPLYVRLFDLGSDKSGAFLGIPAEENPALGFRGARLLEGRPEWFVPQARAIARASQHGPIHVVYPMIVDVAQFSRLRSFFLQCASDIEAGTILHGPMFEAPSALLEADALLECADFGSIGTNDLIQYLLVVDRNNGLVARDYDADHPVVWAAIQRLAKAARHANKPLTVCGEIGGQPQYLPRLLDAGINAVSVSIRLIGPARQAARRYLSS